MTDENSSFNLAGCPGVRTLIFENYNNNHEEQFKTQYMKPIAASHCHH